MNYAKVKDNVGQKKILYVRARIDPARRVYKAYNWTLNVKYVVELEKDAWEIHPKYRFIRVSRLYGMIHYKEKEG